MKTTTVTPVDYAILGLLIQGALSGYQVRMAFEQTALGNFSSSPGSIYPALERLQNQRLVEKKKDSNASSAAFQITRDGTQVLHQWIVTPVERKDVERGTDLLLLRIAFMDTLPPRTKVKDFLSSALQALSSYVDELEIYYRRASADMLPSGRLAFEHGVATHKSTLKWLKKVRRQYAARS
jgi:DNA-binding PadR family transcriptional regulator